MRLRPAVVAALSGLMVVTGLAACGGSGPSSAKTTSTAASSRDLSAINIQPADVPGMVTVNGGGGTSKIAGPLARCGAVVPGFQPGASGRRYSALGRLARCRSSGLS